MSDAFKPDFGASRAPSRRVGIGAFKASDLKVKQNFDNECTVMIWRTSKAWLGYGGLSHPGHASVFLRKSLNEGPFLERNTGVGYGKIDGRKARYVSFWPAGDPDKATRGGLYTSSRDGEFLSHHNIDYENELSARGAERLDEGSARRQGQIMVSANNLGDEVYGQLPDVLISLQALAPSRTISLGLQLNRIVDWCQDFKISPDFNYKYISSSNNCAGVAVRALSAGGGDAFAAVGGCSKKSSIYYTPNDAEDWANSVAVGIQKVNAWLATLNVYSSKDSVWGYGLPTVDQWKTASHKSFSFRGRETRGVDDALADWNACQKGNDPKSFPKAFGALVQLIQHTFMHMQKDPNSKRNEAYRQLARSMLLQVEHLAQKAALAWSPTSYYGSNSNRPREKT
jgi:hypothetical protein